MVRIRTDTFDPESKAVPFYMQVASILGDEGEFSCTSFTAEPPSKDGGFRTVWHCLDGTFITHRHSFATGMGHMHKVMTYSDRFREKLPPMGASAAAICHLEAVRSGVSCKAAPSSFLSAITERCTDVRADCGDW